MPLASSTRLGSYEILAPLGAGGMGEVYRARDVRLGRDVAVKTLPAAFAQDPERLARFEREAKLLASLSHPNVAVVYGLEEVDGARYLVLEYIEGETLAARLARGPLPLNEALDVARQIAAGVEAAHENDVVHRDLKPGNVMLAASGPVKVLDFGLARSGASDRPGSNPNLSASPTMTYAATSAGVILGTAAYMSPEQARGKAVDKRTDVWSFGCVLFECLTGRQAFAGETVSDIVAHILQSEPDWTALPAATPERIRALLARCLEKDAKRRLRDIGDARIEIEDVLATLKSASGMRASVPGWKVRLPWRAILVTAALAVLASVFGPRLFVHPPAPAAARWEVRAPKGHFINDAASVVISPDGRTIAEIAADSTGRTSLWVRRLDDLAPRQLPGTENADIAFWSPDSRRLAFMAGDQMLAKIAVDNGTPERICDTKAARGGTWGRDGTILFAPYSNGGIYRVSASGGTPVPITHPDSARGVTGHRFPVLLPDGKHFLFTTVPKGSDGTYGLCVGGIDGGPTREIGRVETGVTDAGRGWLVTTRGNSLVARRLDEGRMQLVGDPVVLGDPLVGTQYSGGPLASAAQDGTLAYLTREDVPVRAEWYDLLKQQVVAVSPLAPGFYQSVALAPDDRRAIIGVGTDPGNVELLLVDLDRGVTSPLTEPTETIDNGGVWSLDGTRVAYIETRTQTIRVRSLADGSMHAFLGNDHVFHRVYGFTPDGRALLYGRLDPGTKWDIWLLPLDGGAPKVLLNTPANEQSAAISSDGRWLAYQTDESGTFEVCLAPVATPGLKYQVSIGGGTGGFSYDAKRYYYGQGKDRFAVSVADIRGGTQPSLGPARPAFRIPADIGAFDWAHDEHRLIRLTPTEKPEPQAATILQHWQSAVRSP